MSAKESMAVTSANESMRQFRKQILESPGSPQPCNQEPPLKQQLTSPFLVVVHVGHVVVGFVGEEYVASALQAWMPSNHV